jgi:hypothetical protein
LRESERVHINKDDEILRTLGRIEGRLEGIEKLYERVRKLKGALVGALACAGRLPESGQTTHA